jgi:hypothetical protein
VGQDEDAEPLVRRADFCRAEQTRRRRVTHVPKLSQHGLKTEGDVPGDVFKEHPFGAAVADDASDIRPEMAGIFGSAAFACCTERLAGISCEYNVEDTVKDPSIETSEIIPDRSLGEIACALGRDEHSSGPVLPFDKGAGVIAGLGEHEAQIKASAACAEGQSVPGTKHHAIHSTPRWRNRSVVTSPRVSIAPHMAVLIMLGGRNLSELTMSA